MDGIVVMEVPVYYPSNRKRKSHERRCDERTKRERRTERKRKGEQRARAGRKRGEGESMEKAG